MSCFDCFPQSKGQAPKKQKSIGDKVSVAKGSEGSNGDGAETIEVPPSAEPVLGEQARPEVSTPEPNEVEPTIVTTTSVQFADQPETRDEPNTEGTVQRDTLTEGSVPQLSPEAQGVGVNVEYFSATNGEWIPATLLGVDSVTGKCCLDVQPQADKQHVRGTKAGLGPLEVSVGAAVEYHSTTHGWIPALVQGFDTSLSEYVLNVQPRATIDKVRLPLEPFPSNLVELLGPERAPKGLHVAYNSHSVGGWIPAELKGFDEATNTYSLDVHPQAAAERIRFDLRGWRHEVVFAAPGTVVPMRFVSPE